MNHKIFLIGLTLASVISQASPKSDQALLNHFKLNKMIALPKDGPNPDPGIAPIRLAKGKFTIAKSTAVTQSDGQVNFNVETVCTMTGDVGVFDVRQNPDGVQQGPAPQSCTSTLGGQPVHIYVVPSVQIISTQIFPDEGKIDIKAFFGASWTEFDSTTTALAPPMEPVVAAFRDMTQKSVLLSGGTDQGVDCSSSSSSGPVPAPPAPGSKMSKLHPKDSTETCQANYPESFSVVFEIQDDAQ